MGVKLFRLLLPIIGLVTGAMAGFIRRKPSSARAWWQRQSPMLVAILLGLLLAILFSARVRLK